MAKTLTDIPQVFIKNPKLLEELRLEFGKLYDQDSKPIQVYDSRIQKFNEKIHSKEINIDPKLTPKEIGIKLESWFEFLSQNQVTTTIDEPKYEQIDSTLPDSEKLKQFGEEKVVRDEQIKKTKENAKTEVERARFRTEEIIREQQKIQDQIRKAQSVQEQLKGTVYAKVTIPDEPALTNEEQKDLETLKDFAKSNEINRAKLIEYLTEKIKSKTTSSLEGASELEKNLVARSAAVDIVEKLSKTEKLYEIPVQVAILTAIADKKNITVQGVLQNKDDLLETARNGSTILALHARDSEITNKTISRYILGDKFTEVLYGPDKIQVELSQTRIVGQTTHEVNLADLNENSIGLLQQQNTFLQTVRGLGTNESRSLFISQANSYITRQIEKLPTGSAVKKAYSSPIMQSLLSRYGLAQPVVWEATGQTAGFLIKVFPNTAGPVLSVAGKVLGKEFVKPVVAVVSKEVTAQVATKAGFGGLVAKIATVLGVGSGVVTFGISTLITGLIAFVSKKINWPKIKRWFHENGVVIAGFAGLGALFLGGPVAGAVVFGGGLLASGSLGTFALGTFNLLSVIGSSIGIAIATPLIITLLVLPPLVAFIMLVINNSAYVVPPSPVAESGFGPGGSGFVCTTEKTPTSITSPVNSPIATRAWEIMEDMYQGFWCFWNRSPGDFPTDVITPAFAPHYPELFNERLFASNPNPTRNEASSCGECLFWCTWLVQKSYKENGINIMYTLWSPSMYEDFNSRGKILETNEETAENIQPGAVVFFDVDNGLNRIDHVGVVHSVNEGGITFLQSNAGTKDDFIPFGSNGLQDLPGITVVGIGNP